MKRILVIGGTADVVPFLEGLSPEHTVLVSTYGALGADCVPRLPQVSLRNGPLDEDGFLQLLVRENIDVIADLSHPFAREVSSNGAKAARRARIPCYRYERPSYRPSYRGTVYVADFPQAVTALETLAGPIFLTVGSRQLRYFTDDLPLRERLFCRVLADSGVLRQVEDMGIAPERVFAMKGVASAELNVALLRQTGSKVLVTKESGVTGGLPEKEAAAAQLAIPLLVIERPAAAGDVCRDMADLLRRCQGGNHG